MPGMMDTILNLGLNEEVVKVLAEKSGNPRWAWDCYRRFIQMYSDVVMEVGKKYFEELIDEMKAEKGVTQDVDLTAEDLQKLAEQFKAEYKEKIGEEFPTDPKEQLMGAVKAVFRSWDNPRANAVSYTHLVTFSNDLFRNDHRSDRCVPGIRQHLYDGRSSNEPGVQQSKDHERFVLSECVYVWRKRLCSSNFYLYVRSDHDHHSDPVGRTEEMGKLRLEERRKYDEKDIYKKSFAYTHSFDRRYCSHSIPIPLDGVYII